MNAENILAGIGPSICVQHYEVGSEVEKEAKAAFRDHWSQVLQGQGERTHLDLWAANRLILEESGIEADHIEIAGLCTAENLQNWYSHRGENGKTGRFGALLALNEK